MDIDIDLTHLECVGMKTEKHFLVNPVLLQCGHFMCFNCARDEKINEATVHCGTCDKDGAVNFETNPATVLMNKQIESYLGKLFDIVQQKCKTTLSNLKCK